MVSYSRTNDTSMAADTDKTRITPWSSVKAATMTDRKAQAEAGTGYTMDEFNNAGERIAWDRDEDDYCERGTYGCSVRHTRDSECQTW